MPEQEIDERQARSIALEKAYVHDVYDYIAPHFSSRKYHVWPRIKQFLYDLEPGSLVADVGCGQGNYLDINNDVFKIGTDRCEPLLQVAAEKRHEVVHCDNLQLPFRDESLDAALSVAVVHHFATTERRVEAIRELARILRIGGRVMITVWAMEQRHRRFESQDVLVPWHQPTKSSSEDRGSSVEREVNSTTTSDDDILVYQAYSHMSDSDGAQKRHKFRKGRSFDTSSPSSSELSSPNETCYSFVRRALKKLSASTSPYSYGSRSRPYFYSSCRRPWFSECNGPPRERKESIDSESADDQPIELRHLDKNDDSSMSLDKESFGQKSRSLGDILGLIPNLLRSKQRTLDKTTLQEIHKRISTVSDPREYVRKSMAAKNGIVRSKSTVSCIARLTEIRHAEDDEIAKARLVKDRKPATVFEAEKGGISPCATIEVQVTETQVNDSHLEPPVINTSEDTTHLSSYYSMPELHQLPTDIRTEQQQKLTLPITECYDGITDRCKIMHGTMGYSHKDEMLLPVPLRNGFVKRSVSVDTGDNKGVRGDTRPRRFSASATQGLFGSLRTCMIPKSPSRGSSLKSDTSVDSEESIISVIPRNCNSIQSDTSVDSEDSIVSVIQRSSSELETFTWDLRKEALTRSAQTSPLTVNLDRLPSPSKDHIVSFLNSTEAFLGEDSYSSLDLCPDSLPQITQDETPNIGSTLVDDFSAKNDFLNQDLRSEIEAILPKDVVDVKSKNINQIVPMFLYAGDGEFNEDVNKFPEEVKTMDENVNLTNSDELSNQLCGDSFHRDALNNEESFTFLDEETTNGKGTGINQSPIDEMAKDHQTTSALSQILTNISADLLDMQQNGAPVDSGCTSTIDLENEPEDCVSNVRPAAHSFDSGCSNSLPFDDEMAEEVFEQPEDILFSCVIVRDVDPEESSDQESGQSVAKNDKEDSLQENETPPRQTSLEDDAEKTENDGDEPVKSRNTSLSLSTSQESLNGNDTGGSVTFHRYYHVFREGELDSLIEKYVENLHIISSYYDHANWCVIAEKVQVWTI